MRLTELTYSEFVGKPREWKLEQTTFEDMNLIVGKNSAGKTRLLNIIMGLANLLNGTRTDLYESGHYIAKFISDSEIIEYELIMNKNNVELEIFTRDGEPYLERDKTGEGDIEFKELGERMRFQAPITQLAVVNRRDSVQHPFFDELHEWSISVRHYLFGTDLGRRYLLSIAPNNTENKNKYDSFTDRDHVTGLFQLGLDKYGEEYRNAVKNDFTSIGYDCSDIVLTNLSNITKEQSPVLGLSVQEKNLKTDTNQMSMSQGMFRALAIIINLNYAIFKNQPCCILIDDIGEGLDYDRASKIVQIIVEKSKNKELQIFMTTNDRYIMNGIPLENWAVMHREGSVVKLYNKRNSAKAYEDFKYTGLGNFNFFSSNYYLKK